MKKSYHFLWLLSILFLSSCVNQIDYYDLSLEFQGEFQGEKTWVAVQSVDGYTNYDFAELPMNSAYYLDDLDVFRVNLTVGAQKTNLDGKKVINLITYMDLPTAHWNIKGLYKNNMPVGRALINIKDVPAELDNLRLSTRFQTFEYDNVAGDISVEFPVRTLDKDQQFNALSIAYDPFTYEGRYGWINKQKFLKGVNNEFTLSLDQQLKNGQMRSRIPLDYFQIDSYEPLSRGRVYSHFEVNMDAPQIVFPYVFASIPSDQYYFVSGGYAPKANMDIHRHYVGKEIPASFDINDADIKANYNSELNAIENIYYRGETALLLSYWSCETEDAIYQWSIYMPKNRESVQVPSLTDAFYQSIGVERTNFKPDAVLTYNPNTIKDIRTYYKKWLGRKGYYIYYDNLEEVKLFFDE